MQETKNAELPLSSGIVAGDAMMPDDGGIPQLGKERYDYRGKHDSYMGNPRQTHHPFDRKSGTGKGKEVTKGGHGKGNWGDLRDEIEGQLLFAGEDRPLAEEALGGIEAPPISEDTEAMEEEDTSKLTLEEYQRQHGK